MLFSHISTLCSLMKGLPLLALVSRQVFSPSKLAPRGLHCLEDNGNCHGRYVQQVMRHPSWCSPGYTMGSTMAPPLGRTIAPAMLSPPLTGFQTKWSQNSKYVNAPSVRIEYYTLFNSPSQPFDNTSLLSQ